MRSSIRHSAKRARSPDKIRVLLMLYWLRRLVHGWEPDLDYRRRQFRRRIRIFKKEGRIE